MSTVGELVVKVSLDNKKFNSDMKGAKTGLKKLGDDAKQLGTNMTKYATLPILALGAAAVKAASDFERQKTAFGVLLKDVKKGNELFADLQVLASKTPLQIGNITKSAQQLLAAGTQLNDVNETITMLGDIALGDAAKLDTMTRAYSKMQTKGKATMEELNMVTEAGVPILQALGDSMGVSVEKVFELSSKGQIAFSDVKAAMQTLTSETGQFNAGMEKLSQTTAGKFSTAMDNLTISAAEFGVQLLPMVNDLLEGITDLARDFGELDDGTKKVIMTTAAFVAGIGPAIKAVIALKKAFTAMSGPIGIAMLAVTGLVAGISKLNEMSKKVAEEHFGDITRSTGKAAEDINLINFLYHDWIAQGKTVAEAQQLLQKEHKLTNSQLTEILAINEYISEEERARYENLAALNKRGEQLRAITKKTAEEEAELIRNNAAIAKAEKDARIAGVNELYQAQRDRVLEVLEANKSEIEAIDTQIASISELARAEGKLKDDQLEAVEILKAKKQEILDSEAETKAEAIATELAIEQEKTDKLIELAKKRAKEEEDARIARIEKTQAEFDFVTDMAGSINQIWNNNNVGRLNNIEAEKKASIAALTSEKDGNENYAAEKLAIEKKAANDTYKIKKDEFEANKALALIQIAIDTAIGVAKVYGQTGIFGLAAQIPVIAAGVAQAAIVGSQQPPAKPAFAKGGYVKHKAGGVEAIVAEDGDEEIFGMGSKGIPRRKKFAYEVAEIVGNSGSGSGNVYNFYTTYGMQSPAQLRKMAKTVTPYINEYNEDRI